MKEPIKSPIKVGSMLFTMVDPNKGHEVAYNRWYERDHFYAGCMAGPWLFAGSRWVAPRPLKDLRFPGESPIAAPLSNGSYVAIYWHLAGHREDHNGWASPQVQWLYANGRGFPERTHVHTLIYDHNWDQYRDDDPVPVELALDHKYEGLASVMVKRDTNVSQSELDSWYRDKYLKAWMAGSPIASCSSWSPTAQAERSSNAPMHLPQLEDPERVTMQLYFLDSDPRECWDKFVTMNEDLAAAKLGQIIFASPWLPTVVGTDTYTDQLW